MFISKYNVTGEEPAVDVPPALNPADFPPSEFNAQELARMYPPRWKNTPEQRYDDLLNGIGIENMTPAEVNAEIEALAKSFFHTQ